MSIHRHRTQSSGLATHTYTRTTRTRCSGTKAGQRQIEGSRVNLSLCSCTYSRSDVLRFVESWGDDLSAEGKRAYGFCNDSTSRPKNRGVSRGKKNSRKSGCCINRRFERSRNSHRGTWITWKRAHARSLGKFSSRLVEYKGGLEKEKRLVSLVRFVKGIIIKRLRPLGHYPSFDRISSVSLDKTLSRRQEWGIIARKRRELERVRSKIYDNVTLVCASKELGITVEHKFRSPLPLICHDSLLERNMVLLPEIPATRQQLVIRRTEFHREQ